MQSLPALPSDALSPLPPSVFAASSAVLMLDSDEELDTDHQEEGDDDDDEGKDTEGESARTRSAYPQSPRSTHFESMADSPLHSYGTSAMRELLDLQRQKSTILKRLNLLHENLVVPSEQFWSVAADVCDNVNIIQNALKPTIELHSIEDEALHTSSLDLRGFFKEIESILEISRREFNMNRVSSQWSDAQSSPLKIVGGDYLHSNYSSPAGTNALRLLDRTFVLRQRIACHDALLTLHRHMWMARDEQWEGFAREAESFWIRKSKIREAELVQDLANQEEELQETQEALRVLLKAQTGSTSFATRIAQKGEEPGQPTLLAPTQESVRDLRIRLREAAAKQKSTAQPTPSPPPPPTVAAATECSSPVVSPSNWMAIQTDECLRQATLTQAILLLSRQSQALGRLSILVDHRQSWNNSGSAGLRTAWCQLRRFAKWSLLASVPKHKSSFTIAAAIMLNCLFRQIQKRHLSQAFQQLQVRDAIESSSRNFSAVSLVMVPPGSGKRTLPQAASPTEAPHSPGRCLPASATLSYIPDRLLRRTPQAASARSLSPPQFHARGHVAFSRNSSGDLMPSSARTPESRIVMPIANTTYAVQERQRSPQLMSVYMSDQDPRIKARQPPFRRPQQGGMMMQSSPFMSPPNTHVFVPASPPYGWADVPIRPAALQTQRLLLTGQPTEVQKPRALPPMRLPMYEWCQQQQTPTLRSHMVTTWR
eukprot:Gregarina_sp_Pseudo_9__3997@NODE_413_length_2887_cov_6_980688_g390_i0_p1_GENE_NODE_413_length_2887_cov_6_980688_g390_i0NODE_413_length_2887_cov_6_980688_g390_i0_p1_ORF_typecomplete_len711_score83_11CENPB_dimeris/PF09026_10/1_1_NODE_413_length_2887_cov_6_980688_g390_i0202152